MARKIKTYIVYYRGFPLRVGNKKECIDFMNTTKEIFNNLVYRTRKGLTKEFGYQVFCVDDFN